MNVLFISNDSSIFREGSAARERMRGYAAQFNELHIIGRAERSIETQDGRIFLHGIGGSRLWVRLVLSLKARRLIWRCNITVVSVQDPFEFGLLGVLAAKGTGARLHVQLHTDIFSPHFSGSSPWNKLRLLFARYVFAHADRVRVISERLKKGIENSFDVRVPISVLPIYTDIARFSEAEVPQELRSRFGRFTKRVVVVSRLEPEKNVAFAIRAFADAGISGAQLIIVGGGRQLEELKAFSNDLSLEERVSFEGERDPAPYYKLADLVLVPSLYEGYGLVVIEALAAGTPVLARDVGIAREAGAEIADDASFPRKMREMAEGEKRRASLRGYPYADKDSFLRQIAEDIAACADSR